MSFSLFLNIMKYCKAHLDIWKMRYINIYFILFYYFISCSDWFSRNYHAPEPIRAADEIQDLGRAIPR